MVAYELSSHHYELTPTLLSRQSHSLEPSSPRRTVLHQNMQLSSSVIRAQGTGCLLPSLARMASLLYAVDFLGTTRKP